MNRELARFVGLDFGTKRIGVAVADPLGMIATPVGYIPRREGKRQPVAGIIERARELEARGFVIGLPLDGEGNETDWTKEVRAAGTRLAERTSLPVIYVDERYSTARSLRAIREMEGSTRGRRGDVDSLAAAVILQGVLDNPDRSSG